MRRTLLTALVAAAALLGLASPASASTWAAHDQTVTAETTAPGPLQQQRSGVAVTTDPGGTVDNNNVAFAYAHDCTGCRSAAAALQAVIVTGPVTDLSPGNGGFAINENCTSCVTYAFAFQYIVVTDHPVRLTGRDRDALEGIGGQARRLIHSDLAFGTVTDQQALDAQFHDLTTQFKAVIDRAVSRQTAPSDSREQHQHLAA
jgi:hypothetical protein